MSEKRVVVTGLGLVSPLGKDVKSSWEGITKCKSGISNITRFPIEALPDSVSQVVGEVKIGEDDSTLFNPANFMDKTDLRKADKFIWFSMAAAEEALRDAEWKPQDEFSLERTGVMIGSGIGGLPAIQDTTKTFLEKGIKRISPFFIPESLINLSTGRISMKYGFTGPNISFVTACASSTHCIGEAAEAIKRGAADVMVAGGAESAICEIGIGGFSAMHALSTKFNKEPKRASRPWDIDRDGFVMGEGSGILILEELSHAKKRGARIYAELIGYGASADAYHITSPHPNGLGAKKAMKDALASAGIAPEQVDYINAHGTSTPMGDAIEFNAVKEIFSSSLDKLHMSSTKSAIGHLLGAAGAVEAIFSIKSIEDNILPATLNLENVDSKCTGIDLVPNKIKESNVECVLSNSFGFGGTNASIIFKNFK